MMDMPTPCPMCSYVVEFNDMATVDTQMMCTDCAIEYQCEFCDCYSHEVTGTEYGHLCNTCYEEAKEDEVFR